MEEPHNEADGELTTDPPPPVTSTIDESSPASVHATDEEANRDLTGSVGEFSPANPAWEELCHTYRLTS